MVRSFSFLFLISYMFICKRYLSSTSIHSIKEHNDSNCEVESEDYPRICIRCSIEYVLIENQCVKRNQSDDSNCIELTKFGDCMMCECGYSLEVVSNKCVETPENLTGCQVFLYSTETECLRPKPEFELVKSLAKNDFITIQFSNYSNCEIRISESGECKRCNSNFRIDPKTNKCIHSEFHIENVFYSYFNKHGILESRDIRFVASLRGVYPVIHNCKEYDIRTSNKKEIMCKECLHGSVRNESGTLCVKQVVGMCDIVFDEDLTKCKQCKSPQVYYVYEGIACRSRQSNLYERCRKYSRTSDICLDCNPPYVLDVKIMKCVMHSIEQGNGNSLYPLTYKMRNCAYAITFSFCLECDKNYFRNHFGECVQIKSEIPNCQIYNLQGECEQCKTGLYSQNGLGCNIWYIPNCVWPKLTSDILETCLQCKDNFFLLDGVCLIEDQNCVVTDKNNISSCLKCINNFHLQEKNNGKFGCFYNNYYQNCQFSDGIQDKCLLCKSGFILKELEGTPPHTICEPIIKRIGQECENEFAFIANETDQFCTTYSFMNISHCTHFHLSKNECLKCESGFYVDSEGNCIFFPSCKISNGIDHKCLLTFSRFHYILPDGSTIGTSRFQNTNQRDNTSINCFLNGVSGRLSTDDDTCIIFSENENVEFQNCLNVRDINYQSKNNSKINSNTSNSNSTDIMTGDMKRNDRMLLTRYLQVQLENEHKYVCSLCSNLYYISQSGKCEQISDFERCEVSDGRENVCLYCGTYQSANHFLLPYILNANNECVKPETIPVVRFCEQMQEEVCIRCKNLFYLVYQNRNIICIPIDSTNCLSSDGITNKCLVCDEYSPKFHVDPDCLNAFCVEFEKPIPNAAGTLLINQEKKKQQQQHPLICVKCLAGFQLQLHPTRQRLNMCAYFPDSRCLIRNQNGICEKCQKGFILQYLEIIPDCFKIMIPNCVNAVSEFILKCTECEENYLLSADFECLPINERCEVFLGKWCSKCKPQYILWQESNTCEEIANCDQLNEKHCIKCASGYFLSQNNLECIKIKYCRHSLGIHDLCLTCEMGYIFKRFNCFVPSPIDHCLEYDDTLFNCIKCESLFYLFQATTIITSEQQYICIKITENNCAKSDGIYDVCLNCDVTGFILSETSKCDYIPNCIFSDGISRCYRCQNGFYVSIITSPNTSSNEMQLSSCVQQPVKANCEIYSFNETICTRCLNLFFLSKDNTNCLEISKPALKNCLLTDGMTQECDSCTRSYDQFPIEYRCIRESFRQEGCKISHGSCTECFSEFYLLEGFRNNKCQIRSTYIHENNCLVYHLQRDECIYCQNGYTINTQLNHQFCSPISSQMLVSNCISYLPNTNICTKCKQDGNLENNSQNETSESWIQFWLDRTSNKCVNVAQMMCRSMQNNSLVCLKTFIPKCQIYNENNHCIRCGNAYYLHEGACLEHTRILNCLEYHNEIPNICVNCLFDYQVSNDRTQCQYHRIEHCQEYSLNQQSCEHCKNGYSININTGMCDKTLLLNCIKIKSDKLFENHICDTCANNYQWNQSSNACELKPEPKIYCSKIDSSNTCIKCEQGYFLNEKQYCLLINSRCSPKNCNQISLLSTADSIKCEKCTTGYSNENKLMSCNLSELGNIKGTPDEIIKKEKELREQGNKNEDNNLKQSQKPKSNEDDESSDWTLFLFVFISLISFVILFVYLSRKKKQQYLNNQSEVVELITVNQQTSIKVYEEQRESQQSN